ncbi:MAG: hypothetical protein H6Q05_3916, partial [Acidobacteria bacterium]|nr:hypothetical protein [Acidobacteriota bacterium]
AIACFRMCGYIWVFHCREGSSREPIRENDPLDRQSLYTGTKFMPVSKAKEMPRGCCGISFRFQWVGYEYFRLSNPTAIFPLFTAVLASKTEKIFTSEERIRDETAESPEGDATPILRIYSVFHGAGGRDGTDHDLRKDKHTISNSQRAHEIPVPWKRPLRSRYHPPSPRDIRAVAAESA